MPDLASIVRVQIHPAVGIARVGNASDEYFLGPEVPGAEPGPAARFKDANGRIKRQAARFRIYGYDVHDQVVGELTAAEAQITWRVHLCNRKAAWYTFQNAMDLGNLAKPAALRNADYAGDRKRLVNDPGPRMISGIDESGTAYHFNTGSVGGVLVSLGELRTDAGGRLLVLGGHGRSESFDGSQASTFANNDGWFDDTSDGTVRATVEFEGRNLEATPAVVAVTPPNYGPGLYGVVTLDDVVRDLFVQQGWLPNPYKNGVSFWDDVYPVLSRLAAGSWVNEGFDVLFGPGAPSDFTEPALRARLRDPSAAAGDLRQQIFAWFRDPNSTEEADAMLAPVYGDAFGDYEDVPQVELSVTRLQYTALSQWAAGHFDPGPKEPPNLPDMLECIALSSQPRMLDRAPLADCLGGPFHPGIELTWTMRVASQWVDAYRMSVHPEGAPVRMDYGPELTPEKALANAGPLADVAPGKLTWWMGVPWQTDEASCMSGYELGSYLSTPTYWAVRVPNQVLPYGGYERMLVTTLPLAQRRRHLTRRPGWLRFFSSAYVRRIRSMVRDWDKIGIVAERPGPADAEQQGLPERLWIETEVFHGFTDQDPTWELVLIAEGAADPTAGADADALGSRLSRSAAALPPDEARRPAQRRRGHARRSLGRGEH